MKRAFFILSLLFLSQITRIEAQVTKDKLEESRSNENWKKGGLFQEYKPEQEILSARTEYTKKFDRGNGMVDILFAGPFHYKDKNGALQDINLAIKEQNDPLFRYFNYENRFNSRFATNAKDGAIIEFKNYLISFGIDNRISSEGWSPVLSSGQQHLLQGNSITYRNIYNDIDLNYRLNTEAILHKIVFKNKAIFSKLPVNNPSLQIEETITLPKNATISDDLGNIINERPTKGIIKIALDGETLFSIMPSYIHDASYTGNANEQILSQEIQENFITLETSIKFINPNKIKLSAFIPVKWILSSNRVYPITFDPTVNVGNVGNFSSTYRYPFNTCRQQRVSQILFLKDDINNGGINTTGTITQIDFLQGTNNPIANNNIRIKMQEVVWNLMTTPVLTSSGFSDCYGPASQNFTSGGSNTWRPFVLSSPFAFTNTKNLLLEVSFNNSPDNASGCTCDNTAPGGHWGWFRAPYAGHRWAYSNSSATPPSGGDCNYNNSPEGNPAYGYFIPATRITINTTGGCVPISFSNQPSSQTVVAPSQTQFSITVIGTSPTYQWEMSTNGGLSWNNVPIGSPYSGNTTAQLTINTTAATLNDNRYRCKVTNACTAIPAISNTAVLTVNAAGCATVISPASSAQIPAIGGTGSFNIDVTPNTCSWSASETLSWVTITSPLSGTGDGKLNYTVAATNGGPKSGTIIVNGQTHTINQQGAAVPTTYTISGRVVNNGSVGIPGVTILTTPAQGSATTDPQGYYTLTVPLTYIGTVKALLAPYVFKPLSITVSATNYRNKDFETEAVSIRITKSEIPPWQREGDDYEGSISVEIINSVTKSWHLEADVYDANNVHKGNVRFPSVTAETYKFNTGIGAAGLQLMNLSLNERTIKFSSVFDANISIEDHSGNVTKIIEKKWDRKNIVFYNGTNVREIKIPIKWSSRTPTKIKFSRLDNTSMNLNGFSLITPDPIKGTNVETISEMNGGYFIINNTNSNLVRAQAGDFKFEMLGETDNLLETGTFDLTKIGKINDGLDPNKILVMIGGIFNEMETSVNALVANTFVYPPSNTQNPENIASPLSYSIIEYCRNYCSSGFSTWYISQGNSNYISRNGYDIGIALQELLRINPNITEINLLCHSKGGLDTRALLGSYNIPMKGSPRFNFPDSSISQKVKKVVFLATPHKGANKANFAIKIIPFQNLNSIPGIIDLMQTQLSTISQLNKTPMPSNIYFLNITGYKEFDDEINGMGDQVVKVIESENPNLFSTRQYQLYQHDARNDCSPNSFCKSFPDGLFHMMIHKNIFLNYSGSNKYIKGNCTENKSNLNKLKEFLDAPFLSSNNNCSTSWFHNYVSIFGSRVTGANISLKTQDKLFNLGQTDETGKIFFKTRLNLLSEDSLFLSPNGYDPIAIPISESKNMISLFKINSPLVTNPSFSIVNDFPITHLPTIQVKVTGNNVLQYLINRHNSNDDFVPLNLTNNQSTISLDTGFNRIIIKFCGIDTVIQIKDIYYFPGTLMNDFTMDCSLNLPAAFNNSKMFLNNAFYKEIVGNSKIKIPKGINEINFSKFGYFDTTLIVDSGQTINLSMQPHSYSSFTDSTIFNFNNTLNPQYWKTITLKNLSLTQTVQLSAKQYDDAFTGMSVVPKTRKFAFRRIGSSDATFYKTAIALDQIHTPNIDSIYLLSIKGDTYSKYLPNVVGITEYDPEVQKVQFDKLDFTTNTTHEIVLMQKQPPVMKPVDTIWRSGQTLVFPISMFVSDPDSIKNDITASSSDQKVVVNGNFVYVTAPVNFTGTTTFTLTGTHDWLDRTKVYTMKVIPPDAFVPTAFTPNDDGLNDMILPIFMGKLLKCHFTIYNRQGQVVFETKDCLKGWDGKVKGQKQPTNSFVYTLTYQFEGTAEEEKQLKGTITLIR